MQRLEYKRSVLNQNKNMINTQRKIRVRQKAVQKEWKTPNDQT